MKVGILCEFSGVVRDAFRALGHDAMSCDILPTEVPGPHIQGDCLAQDWTGFDLLICHPPCTFLCNSGVCHIHTDPMRRARMEAACGFFNAMLALPCARIAVENPIMHCHAKARIGMEPSQYVQPWMFGHGETKATGLWLKGLPALSIDAGLFTEPQIVEGREQRLHKLPPGPNRSHERSRTFPGIARGMAAQWGSLETTP